MASPLLSRPGAVAAGAPDDGVAAHYGDPLREQRLAAGSGRGLTDRSNRDVIRVDGADRLTWLHSLTSQHLAALPPNVATEALVLSPHGHVEHHLVLTDDGTTTWIHVEPGTGDALRAFLDSMRFMLRVTVSPTDLAVLTHGAEDLLVPDVEQAWDRLVADGATPLGMWGYDALRVAARRPRLGFETDHRTIPHEVGWLANAVHLDKGCYRGQETVARVHNLGRPPRRLVLLHLDGSVLTLPARGEPMTWEGAQVGFVGTAARHYELGPIALALVKRNTPDDAPLVAGGVPALVAVAEPVG
ncbi:MAG: tRNA-modifying protein YgfZ [Frankiaceae bacterium]|jgi:folate-binding protein YgfZ|nr:tRNA-modifying protein YgfZ [Frankiaceae bacterium]